MPRTRTPAPPERAAERRLPAFAAALALLTGGIAAAGEETTDHLSPLAIETASGRHEFQVELARTPEQRARGLMFRRELAEDRGMLFDFGAARPVTMWMRNTYIPLDMLFIEPDGSILRIEHDAQPLAEAIIPSGGPVKAVLELPGGTAARLGIRSGDHVFHPIFGDRPAGGSTAHGVRPTPDRPE